MTIPNGQLPIKPEITPGWGVAGVILILTGVGYTLIGIKNRWIQTFFSTAYMVALAVTVLIIYVMSVPVKDAVQGAYVVAAVVAGCGFGVLSMWFKELNEGLGCALGGFCISMWLLCLVPGGLLRAMLSKSIFIACFTLVAFSCYFSHHTRDWAIILMTSFAGATITVLGIDCFSRAGLKEFWAYVWKLNKKLFPSGADTYPVTKGIRVETAAIIIIFLFGIVSQIKLWRLVREQRERRVAELAQGQRNMEEEEEEIGRRVEESNARERQEWEGVYGNGDMGSSTMTRGSDAGETSSEKRFKDGQGESTKRQSSMEVIELSEIPEAVQQKPVSGGLMGTTENSDGKVTIRVATDDALDVPESAVGDLNEKSTEASASDIRESNPERESQRTSFVPPVIQSQGPEVIPLPFKIPDEDDMKSTTDRSSIATFADDEVIQASTPVQRNSFAKRLSQGSANLLRSLSQRSGGGTHQDISPYNGESTEVLVMPSMKRNHDNDGSVAATIDEASVDVSDRQSFESNREHKNIEMTPGLRDKDERDSLPTEIQQGVPSLNGMPHEGSADNCGPNDLGRETSVKEHPKAKSSISTVSTPASLTKDRLPQPLSRVALSYRTNEWAKHLSKAETPDPDELRVDQPAALVTQVKEKAVPLDVVDLQKAADEGTPAPASTVTQSDSQMSHISKGFSSSRNSSRRSVPSGLMISGNSSHDPQNRSPTSSTSPTSPTATNVNLRRSSSISALRRKSSRFEPIVEERDGASVAALIPEETDEVYSQSMSPPLPEQAGAQDHSPIPGIVSYSSPQTLIGQRDRFLRSRSLGNLTGSPADFATKGYDSPSDAGSLNNYPAYDATTGPDVDDLPLSQRKELMRQNSLLAFSSTAPAIPRVPSMYGGLESSDNVPFNSHQPRRISTLPPPAARDARLASFRQSVAEDLRSGTPIMNKSGRETPFASAVSLLGSRESEVQRNIDMNRSYLLNQREAEGQRREMQRRQREWNEQVFDERMRSGDLLEAHRDAMRRLQRHAKD